MREKPHILFVEEKWTDANPAAGVTNNSHNLWGSLEASGLATFECFHVSDHLRQYGTSPDEALLELCLKTKPDLICLSWLVMPGRPEINPLPQTLAKIKFDFRIPLFALWYDTVNPKIRACADLLSDVVTLHMAIDSSLTCKKGVRNPGLFYPAWTPEDPRICFRDDRVRDIPVSFNGSVANYKDRIDFLQALVECGIQVRKSGGQRESDSPVTPLQFCDIYRRSQITINFCMAHGEAQAKGRIFEATQCGALLMEQANPETRLWLRPGIDYVEYSDPIDLAEKVKYYLQFDKEREKIAQSGWERSSTLWTGYRFWEKVLGMAGLKAGSPPEASEQPEVLPLPPDWSASEKPNLLSGTQGSRVWCTMPWYSLHFHPEGHYSTCCHIKSLGHAGTPSSEAEVMPVWNSPAMVALRDRLVTGKVEGTPCATCYDRKFQTDHELFGMSKDLPRRALPTPAGDAHHGKLNIAYQRGETVLSTPPPELYAFTSELCNLKCVMCMQNIKREQIDVERFTSLIKDIGWDRLDRVGFIGGEPFLGKDGLELLHFASVENPHTCIYITTNATLVHKHMETLEKVGNLFLNISIDGIGKAYEKIRVNAKFDDLMKNLMLLKDAKTRHPNWRFGINFLVTASTWKHSVDMVKLGSLLDAGVFFSAISGGHPTEDILANPLLVEDFEAFDGTVRAAMAWADRIGDYRAYDSARIFRQTFREAAENKAPHIFNRNSDALVKWGRRFFKLGDQKRSLDCLRESLNLNPANVETLLEMSNWSRRVGDVQLAKELVVRARYFNPYIETAGIPAAP